MPYNTCPKIKKKSTFYCLLMCLKSIGSCVYLIIHNVLWHLIRVCTVCIALSVPKLRVNSSDRPGRRPVARVKALFFNPKKHFRGTSDEYPQHMFLWRNKKNINLIPTLI